MLADSVNPITEAHRVLLCSGKIAHELMRGRFPAILPPSAQLELVAWPESASPATGSKARHGREQAELLGGAVTGG